MTSLTPLLVLRSQAVITDLLATFTAHTARRSLMTESSTLTDHVPSDEEILTTCVQLQARLHDLSRDLDQVSDGIVAG